MRMPSRALAIREGAVGPDHHPDTVASVNDLAALYQAQGRLRMSWRRSNA